MNDERVRVSIVVPVYNTEQYLPRCLKSICGQTLKEIEVILVDDGSEDNSGEICDKFAVEDTRIRVIHKTNGGSTSARQEGLAVAVGEYVGFVDSDDWIEPDMYQVLYEMAVCNRADIVLEGIFDEIENKSWSRMNLLASGIYRTAEERRIIYEGMISCQDFFALGIQPYLCNKLVRRELAVLQINRIPRSIRVGEDAAAVYPILVQSDVIVLSDTAHYHYCHRTTSIMLRERQEDEEYENAIRLYLFLKKMFKRLEVYEATQKQLWRYTINNLLTRSYRKFVKLDRENVLFPFVDVSQNDSIVIYGAGALGKEVYEYALSCGNLKVKSWIDQRAELYQKLGLNVQILENVTIKKSDKVVIAVFSKSAYFEIRKKLMKRGVTENQIKWIDERKLWELPIMEQKIYILGAHSRAQTLATYIQYLYPGIMIEAFLYDNDETNPDLLDGVNVCYMDTVVCAGLHREYPVFLGTRGVYHRHLTEKFRELGFTRIYPVTVELDLKLRNAYMEKYFRNIGREFRKIDHLFSGNDGMTEKSAAVYVVKSVFDNPLQEEYKLSPWEIEIQVGASLTNKRICSLLDNTGENISEQNQQFCELTALYWMWKNATEEIVGLAHYRRHFILPENWKERMLWNKVDAILPVPLYVAPSLAENYKSRHNPQEWDIMMNFLKENNIQEHNEADTFFRKNLYSPCNMFIVRREVLDSLCSWLFPILFAVTEHGGRKENTYQNRYPGFLSERLITYFFEKNRERYKVAYADKNFLH